MELVTREVPTHDLKEVINKLIPDRIGKGTEKACQSMYLPHEVFVRKVKMLKKPKLELGKLTSFVMKAAVLEKLPDETGAEVERADGDEPPD